MGRQWQLALRFVQEQTEHALYQQTDNLCASLPPPLVVKMNSDSGLTLPTEITTRIFHFCLPAEPYITPSPKKAPLLLARICHRWREICLDTPSLWASIACDDRLGAVPIELLESWLSRARSRPLAVHLHSWDVTRATMLMRAVAHHSSRLEDVQLIFPGSVHQQLSTLTFPRLKHIVILNYILPSTPGVGSVTIQDAPLLQHAIIINICLILNSSLGQLTSLRLFAPRATITEHIDVLRCCPNLLDLNCGDEWIGASAPLPLELELSLLRSLKIPDAQLLPYLTAPLLERLEMLDIVRNVSAEALASFVSRSRALQSLSMRVGVAAASVVPAQHMLRAAHSLTHVALSFADHSDFEQLLPELQPAAVLPRLRRLEFRCKLPNKPVTYERLLEMLKQRRKSGALEVFGLVLLIPLRSVEGPPAPVMDEFWALADAGLHLCITAREDVPVGAYTTLLDTCTQPEIASLSLEYSAGSKFSVLG
ncbi:hypothetical protein DFH06DRAFT_581093 [Mycena polygramma]|nr:hypothetical protein DFH06DRAFT_581093 [Mycena polygramma]